MPASIRDFIHGVNQRRDENGTLSFVDDAEPIFFLDIFSNESYFSAVSFAEVCVGEILGHIICGQVVSPIVFCDKIFQKRKAHDLTAKPSQVAKIIAIEQVVRCDSLVRESRRNRSRPRKNIRDRFNLETIFIHNASEKFEELKFVAQITSIPNVGCSRQGFGQRVKIFTWEIKVKHIIDTAAKDAANAFNGLQRHVFIVTQARNYVAGDFCLSHKRRARHMVAFHQTKQLVVSDSQCTHTFYCWGDNILSR